MPDHRPPSRSLVWDILAGVLIAGTFGFLCDYLGTDPKSLFLLLIPGLLLFAFWRGVARIFLDD